MLVGANMFRVSFPFAAACSLLVACSSGTGDGTGGAGNDGSGAGTSTGGTGAVGTGGTTNGTGAAAGTGGTSTGGTGGGSGGGGAVDCASLPVCDDFDDLTAGAQPDSATWGLQLSYSGSGGAENVAATTAEAHSSPNSIKVTGDLYGMTIDNPGESFYLRAWMKSVGRVGWPVLLGLGTSPDAEVRVRLKSGSVTANIVPGDGLNPVEATTGDCPSCVAIPTDWFCLRVHADHATQTFEVWVGDAPAASVTGNAPWHSGTNTWPASFSKLRLGMMSLEGAGGDIYIDDVAIGSSPIGCE